MNTKTAVRPKARVLKDIYTERDSQSHKTAKGKKLSVRTVKAPGLGPKGNHRFVLPFTVFLKFKDIGANILPSYQEEFVDVAMSLEQGNAYAKLAGTLTTALRQALLALGRNHRCAFCSLAISAVHKSLFCN